MIVPFIPFFLVARIGVNENAWRYGPEYRFDVHINLTGIPEPNPYRESILTMAETKLFCRPKSIDTLTCQLENGTVTNRLNISADKKRIDKTNPAITIVLGPVDTFNIHFNERGIDRIVLSYRTRARNINTMKDIVSLLNIGANLNGVPDGEFETFENSAVGECNVRFKVYHRPGKIGRGNRPTQHGYELESLPQLNKVPGETIQLEKVRNLNNCSSYADYLFGFYDNVQHDKRLDTRLSFMGQSILVSDTTFSSTSIRKGFVGLSEKAKKFVVSETISLSLQSIEPADEEWPPIDEPAVTTLLANAPLIRQG